MRKQNVGTVSFRETADRSDNILELRNISKYYPGVVALDGVSLAVRRGEIHALVGENGAGKSTLIKTCSGAIAPSAGQIVINGQTYERMTPKQSENLGIGVIYQEFNLVNGLSVAENIFLGRPIRKGWIVDRKAMERASQVILNDFQIDIDPNMNVRHLTVAYQQMVEIAKAIALDARVLIMDEPSAPLTNQEVDSLFSVVRRLRDQGVTIIYISHRLEEILTLSDRVTVLRDGALITTLETAETNKDELIHYMVGRQLNEVYPKRRPDCIRSEVLFEAEGVSGNGVSDISFKIRKGEVLGLGGLIGAGRTELAELIFGVKPKLSGSFYFKGQKLEVHSPKEAIRKGIALVPEDRKGKGALLDMSIKANINMPIYPKISNMTVVNRQKEKETALFYREEFKIKTPSVNQTVKNLSGGNQQKVILAKWLAANSELLIFDEPTRGIDVGAKHEIYQLMNRLVEDGKAVIMISSEMEELIGMSDRIIVLAEGMISGTLDRSEFDPETVLTYASEERENIHATI